MTRRTGLRLIAVLVTALLAFGLVAGRLVHLQVVAPDHYASIGHAQRVRSIALPADRGALFDRNGHELALSVPQHTVWADPRLVTDPRAYAAALGPILDLDPEVVRERLIRTGAFVYLARQIDDERASRVRDLGLAGINVITEPRRFRPAGDLAAAVLGTVDLDNIGVSGLELHHDELLAGVPGELVVERALGGMTIPSGEHRLRPAERGADLVLTLDRSLQYEAERLLAEQIAATGAKGGMVVLMAPRSGDILAMASLRAGAGDDPTPRPTRDNMAVTTVFEPGSVNKVITLAGAIEEGLFTADDVLVVPDRLRVSTHVFSDHERHPPERWSVSDILTRSSNVGTIMIAQELGRDRFDAYLRRFGFGERTALGFPAESAGLMLEPGGWSGTSIGSLPIGQGVSVTALQMLLAYNVIANDGVYVAPRLVKASVDADGTHREARPAATRPVVSGPTAVAMTDMLVRAVEEGTGVRARIEGYPVAGKTGTARKPLDGVRGYKPGAYMASFAGFVPADDPKLSMIVVLDEPHPIYGGVVAAPLFADLARYALRHLRIPPGAAVVGEEPEPPPGTLTEPVPQPIQD